MIDHYGLGRRGTNSGASASAITDAVRFTGHRGAERIEVGCAVWIDSTVADAAPLGEFSFLSSTPTVSGGVMSLVPSLTAALASTNTFSVLYKPLRFDGADGVNNAINQALSDPALGIRWQRLEVPISLCPDADMRTTATTDWTTGAGTLSKSTPTGAWPLGQPVLTVTIATADYVENAASIPVDPDETYYIEATVRLGVTTDAWSLYLRDVTNGANVTPSGTYVTTTRRETQVLSGIVTVPATCELARVRLVADTGSATAAQLTNVILRKVKARRFTIMDRPTPIMHMGKLLSTTEPIYERRGDFTEIPAKVKQLQDNMWEFWTEQDVSGSLWFEEYIMPTSLTSDSSTTGVPTAHAAAVGSELVLRPLRTHPGWGQWYEKAALAAVRVRQEYMSLHTEPRGQRIFVAGPRV